MQKKTLLARLELSGEVELEYNGKKYTRDGIDKLFESYLSETNWKYYQYIEQDKDLKEFLQTGTWKKPFQNTEYFSEKDFVAFVEGWYTQSYEQHVLFAFRRSRPELLRSFFTQVHPISAYKRQQADSNTLAQLQKTVLEIRNLSEDRVAMRVKGLNNLREYYNESRIECVNLLPVFFTDFRDHYALALIELYIVLNNDYKKENECDFLIKNALRLRVQGYAQHELKRMEEYWRGKNKSSASRLLWLILPVILLLVRLCVTTNRDHAVNYPASDYSWNTNNMGFGEKTSGDAVKLGYVTNTDFEESAEFMRIFRFYARQTGFLDTSVLKAYPMEKEAWKYYAKLLKKCKPYPPAGKYHFTVANRDNQEFILFSTNAAGSVWVDKITPGKTGTYYVNDEHTRVYVIGGGEIRQVVESKSKNKNDLASRVPFSDCSERSDAGYKCWSDAISFEKGYMYAKNDSTLPEYNIQIYWHTRNRYTEIENRVKVIHNTPNSTDELYQKLIQQQQQEEVNKDSQNIPK